MENIKQFLKKIYSHSFVRYLIIGGSTFAIDFLLLVLLHGVIGTNVLVAATISYWTSIVFNFLANRFWTFGSTDTHVIKHIAYYGVLLVLNYMFTIAFIGIATDHGMHYTYAKVLAVAIQMTWTYILYKKVIFK
jgi:putative flippase GtrA